MKFNKIQEILCFGFKGRQYLIRHSTEYIDEINEKDYKIVYEENPQWDGEGVLMVILDNGEPITLEKLKQKRIELENIDLNKTTKKTLEEENEELKLRLERLENILLTLN
jgi:uroporphyrinogen-III synthase